MHSIMSIPPHPANSRAKWGFFCFVVGFIVYGSLFPFDFQSPKPLSELLEWQFPGSTTDAIDNFLLFIPLGIVLPVCFRSTGRLIAAAVISLLLLGLGLQWAQLYLPSRTASLTDVAWNTIGLLAGLAAALPLRSWLSRNIGPDETAIDRFAALLVLLWLTYESFPFVPTLDIGLLRDHIKSVIFAPPFEVMRFTQHFLAATMAGFALQRSGIFSIRTHPIVLLATVAVALEIFVPYGSLRRETMLGIVLGLVTSHQLTKQHMRLWSIATVAGTALGALTITFLTPFRGQASDGGFTLTPFSSIFWQGVTKDLPPLAFETLAICTLIWIGLKAPNWPQRQPKQWFVLILVLLGFMEAVRVTLIGFHGDTTTLLLALVVGSFALTKKTKLDHDITSRASSTLLSTKNRQHYFEHREHNTTTLHPSIKAVWLATLSNPLQFTYYIGYVLAIILFISYLLIVGYERSLDPLWLVFWASTTFLLCIAPFEPIIGLFIYLIISYGISSNGSEYDLSLSIRLRDGIAAIALIGFILSRRIRHNKTTTKRPDNPTVFLGLSLFIWISVCLAVALIRGTPWGPFIRLDPSTYFHAAVMFLIAASELNNKVKSMSLVVCIISTIIFRSILQGKEGIYLESYIATLTIITLPICGAGFSLTNRIDLRITFVLLAAVLLGILAIGQNRNAGIAVMITFAVFSLQNKKLIAKKYAATASFVVLASIFSIYALHVGYYDRFRALWDKSLITETSQLDRSTADGRFKLWEAAWGMGIDHPVFGVGPGNYANYLPYYLLGQSPRHGAHNSYLQMFAETGYFGLLLYVVFFVRILVLLNRAKAPHRRSWQDNSANMLTLSIIAYLSLGIFNNRNDLVLAYVIAGWAVAFAPSKSKRSLDQGISGEH
jgi:VanZ family protein